MVSYAPGRQRPKRRERCPVCGRAVAVDLRGRLVGHGLHKSCPGGYEFVQRLTIAWSKGRNR
jgi:hypothetical protein